MNENFEELKEIFKTIKKQGWIESHRRGPTGIGKTFEDLLDKKEDNLALPDFKNIEVKSQRNATSSMITLFTKSPDYPVGVNTILREWFGNVSSKYDNKKILHTTINAKNFNTHVSGNNFKILVDKDLERIVLQIQNNKTKEIIYESAYWSFKNIQYALEHKLKYIAVVGGDERKEDSKNYFKYTNMTLITGITLDKFIEAIENGDILVDIRIGVYNSGKLKGKTHDHGTGFRITLNKLLKYGIVSETIS